jgi:fatty-acyl-CoA synthase
MLHPNRVALTAPERTLTYRQLHERADRAAALLSGELQLTKGDRLAIYVVNCLEWFEVVTAAARLGVVVVPLNVRLTVPELQYQVRDSGCTALVAGQEFWAGVPALVAGTSIQRVLTIAAPSTPDAAPASIPGVSSLAYEQAMAAAPAVPPADAAEDGDPLFIVYTSGTTGKPKGAILTHSNMLYNALNNCVGLGLTAEDTTLTILPLFHVGGIGLFALPTLYTGGRVVVPRKFDPAESLRLIEQERVTVTMVVPTIMTALVQALRQMNPRPDLSSSRGFISGGAPCPAELNEAARELGLSFGQGMGMTESAPTLFLQPEMMFMRDIARGSHIGRPGTIGKPSLFCDVKLLDEEGRDIPPGEVGEICLRGGNVFAGYWNLPEATAKSFTPDGFFRSGDLARADADGYYTIMGRKKEMLISGGENVYPLEVESVLNDHPAVAEVAVVGVPDARWGEVPGAAVVLHPGATTTIAELTAFCRSRLAGYKSPKHWLILPELPRTAIGKVIKPELVARFTAGK